MCTIHHRYWVIGRILIRTFLAGATKDAAICFVSEEQTQKSQISCERPRRPGRKTTMPRKGIYINNGRKVLK